MSKKDSFGANSMFGKVRFCLTSVEQRDIDGFLFCFDMQYVSTCIMAAIISCGEMCRQRAKFLLPDIDGTDDACLRKMIVCERREILPELFDGYYITSCVSMDKKHTEESGKCPMAVDALNRSRIP